MSRNAKAAALLSLAGVIASLAISPMKAAPELKSEKAGSPQLSANLPIEVILIMRDAEAVAREHVKLRGQR